MTQFQIQHYFQGISGIAEDRYVNTFYAEGPTPADDAAYLAVAVSITRFYSAVAPTATFGVNHYLSNEMSGPGETVKIYNMADPHPRAPVFTHESDPTFDSPGDNLPGEVAVCLSYAGTAVSGLPPARRRGRIFIGPLQVRACETSGDNTVPCRPALIFRQNLVKSAQNLKDELFDGSALVWSMWSPTSGSMLNIVRVWADNAFDTQRRRGVDPNSRVSLNLV